MDKTHKILIAFGVILLVVILFVSRPFGHGKRAQRNATVAELEARIQKLETELDAFVKLKVPSDLALKKEREKVVHLENRIKQQVSDRESMARELSRARADMALTGNIRKKLSEIEKTLDARRLSSTGESQIRKQLRDVEEKLNGLDAALLPLAEKRSVQASAGSPQGSDRELVGRLALAEKAKASLEEEVRTLEKVVADLRQKNAAAARGADERSVLERKLGVSEKTVTELREASNALSAGLKTLEENLAEVDSKQDQLLKEKKDAIREKLEMIKEASVLKDKLISLDQGNRELTGQLQVLKTELADLQASYASLKAEKEAVNTDLMNARAAGSSALALKDEVSRLQNQLKQLSGDYAALKEEYAKASREIEQNKVVSGERAERVLTLQEKLAKAESSLNAIQVRIQSAEKDSALLRQEFVALQIEREDLVRQLSLAKTKFNDAQSKLRQISTLFNAAAEEAAQQAQESVQPVKQDPNGVSDASGASSGTDAPDQAAKSPSAEQSLAYSQSPAVRKPVKKVNVEIAPQSGPLGSEVK